MEMAPASIEKIKQCAESGDAFNMGQEAHSLKGSCMTIGIQKMTKICEILQERGENQNMANIDQLLNQLEQSYQQTIQELENMTG